MPSKSLLCRTSFTIAMSFAFSAHGQSAESVIVKPDPAHLLAQKFAEPARTAQATAPAQPTAKVERPSLDYEMEMLRRARAEAEELKASKLKDVGNPRDQKTSSDSESAKNIHLTNQPTPTTHLNQKSTNAADDSEPTPTAIIKSVEAVKTPTAVRPATSIVATRATILLVMDENTDTLPTKPDPILCMGDTCHVSSGFERATVNIDRQDAMSLTNSRAASPNSCMGHSACVFRDVPVPSDAVVDVVDLGSAQKFESKNGYSAEVDRSCKTSNGILSCEHPLSTSTFRVWIVPEGTATSAGAEALESAIVEGLPHMNVSRADDK